MIKKFIVLILISTVLCACVSRNQSGGACPEVVIEYKSTAANMAGNPVGVFSIKNLGEKDVVLPLEILLIRFMAGLSILRKEKIN